MRLFSIDFLFSRTAIYLYILLLIAGLTILHMLIHSNILWFRALALGVFISPHRLLLMRIRRVSSTHVLGVKIKCAQADVYIDTEKLERYYLSGVDMDQIANEIIKSVKNGVDIDPDILETHMLSGGNATELVDMVILAHKAGLNISIHEMAAHQLSNGNLRAVVESVIMARNADIDLSFEHACAIDLSGCDIRDAVKSAINPKMIQTKEISAASKDGIELIVTANVTVRTDMDNLIGGAGEETVLARVGEVIQSKIGANKHNEIIENPGIITERMSEEPEDGGDDTEDRALKKWLSKDTQFLVVSVDIANIDVGQNIGAQIRIQNAEADAKTAWAQAEKEEQDIRNQILYNRALYLKKRAELQEQIALGIREGKVDFRSWKEIENLEADTEMRRSLSSDDDDLEDLLNGDDDESPRNGDRRGGR